MYHMFLPLMAKIKSQNSFRNEQLKHKFSLIDWRSYSLEWKLDL